MYRRLVVYPRAWVALVAAIQFLGSSAAAQSSTQIAFVHVDGDCSNLATCAMNLRLLDPQNPTQQVALTSFAPTVLVDPLVWSKDYGSLTFASTLNADHSLEMPRSVFAINADGTNLRQITGLGVLAQYTGPTATVQGQVVAPTIHVPVSLPPGTFLSCPNPPTGLTGPCQLPDGTYLVPPTRMVNCSVTTQGGPTTLCSTADGSYSLSNVPVQSSWVRGFALVNYNDPYQNIPSYIPTMGWTSIILQAGQATNATINTEPTFPESNQPSWSRDGSELIVTSTIRQAETQMQVVQSGFVLYSAGGTPLGNVPLPSGCVVPICAVSGSDWSPIANRIAFALNGVTLSAQIFQGIGTMNPDGTSFQWIVQQTPNPLGPVQLVQQARWSPDATRIAFTVDTLTVGTNLIETYDLYVVNVNGTGLTQLTRNQSGQTIQGFSWSPDGSTIAFDITNTGQLSIGGSFPIQVPVSADIFTVKADGTEPAVKLTTDGRSFGPAWGVGSPLQAVKLSPTSLSFGNQSVGTTSTAETVTLTNRGLGTLLITGIAITGTNSGDFAQTNACATSVAAGASCTFNISFTPTVPGARSGTLAITDNAPSSPQTVALSGTGSTDFSVSAASGSSTSATVTAGGTATYTLAFTGTQGFNGTVSLSCSGAPSASTCTLNPTSVTLSGTSTVNATVSVATTARSIGAPRPHLEPPAAGRYRVLLRLFWWLLAMMLASLGVSRRRRARLAAGTALLCVLLFAALAMPACGGGGGSGGGTSGNTGSPSGTYNLTVTGTYSSASNTLVHSITLQLTVM